MVPKLPIRQLVAGFLAGFLTSGSLQAATPTVTSLSTTPTQGGAYTVTVTNAGVKSPAKPLLWADFEAGTLTPSALGTTLAFADSALFAASTDSPYKGTYSAKTSTGWRNTSEGAYLQINWALTYGTTYFVSLRQKSSQGVFHGASDGQNQKTTLRMWANQVGGGAQSVIIGGSQIDGSTIVTAEQISPQVVGTTLFYVLAKVSSPGASWEQRRYIGKHNSALGAADGELSLNIDGTSYGATTGFKMDVAGKAGPLNILRIQQTLANNSSDQWASSGDGWLDNIYIDTGTYARVEIGNASTYSASTVLAPQIPSAWADTSITVTGNLEGLTLANAYLYVTNGSNETSSGYSLGVVGKSTACPCR